MRRRKACQEYSAGPHGPRQATPSTHPVAMLCPLRTLGTPAGSSLVALSTVRMQAGNMTLRDLMFVIRIIACQHPSAGLHGLKQATKDAPHGHAAPAQDFWQGMLASALSFAHVQAGSRIQRGLMSLMRDACQRLSTALHGPRQATLSMRPMAMQPMPRTLGMGRHMC